MRSRPKPGIRRHAVRQSVLDGALQEKGFFRILLTHGAVFSALEAIAPLPLTQHHGNRSVRNRLDGFGAVGLRRNNLQSPFGSEGRQIRQGPGSGRYRRLIQDTTVLPNANDGIRTRKTGYHRDKRTLGIREHLGVCLKRKPANGNRVKEFAFCIDLAEPHPRTQCPDIPLQIHVPNIGAVLFSFGSLRRAHVRGKSPLRKKTPRAVIGV